jgi:hypothetical protein
MNLKGVDYIMYSVLKSIIQKAILAFQISVMEGKQKVIL